MPHSPKRKGAVQKAWITAPYQKWPRKMLGTLPLLPLRHMVPDSTLPFPFTYPPSSQRGGITLWVSSIKYFMPSPRATFARRAMSYPFPIQGIAATAGRAGRAVGRGQPIQQKRQSVVDNNAANEHLLALD